MAKRKFPPIPERPKEPWVEILNPEAKTHYDEVRQNDINNDVKGITELLHSLDDFKGLPEEALGYVALRLATAMTNGYEEGFQHGLEEGRRQGQKLLAAEQASFGSMQRNWTGNWY